MNNLFHKMLYFMENNITEFISFQIVLKKMQPARHGNKTNIKLEGWKVEREQFIPEYIRMKVSKC